jgi:hypothetical protein
MAKSPNPRRVRQHQRLVENAIAQSGGVNGVFGNFTNRPTGEQALRMFEVGRFGGGDPLTEGGIDYALEYAFDEFNEAFATIQRHPDWQSSRQDVPGNFSVFRRGQNEPWANLLFSIFVDKAFAPYVSQLSRSEFVRFTDHEEELIHDQTRSIVFDLKFMGVLNLADEAVQNEEIHFSRTELKGEMVYHYSIWIATPDMYADEPLSQERQEHGVREHTRNLASGKIASVRAHSRRNRLVEARVPWDEFQDHIVYCAYDSAGVRRYIGEGRPDRHNHVNSGISHNYRLNQYHFLNGYMKVEIIAEGLTKPTALAIERFLIGRDTSNRLWNIRDNPAHDINI